MSGKKLWGLSKRFLRIFVGSVVVMAAVMSFTVAAPPAPMVGSGFGAAEAPSASTDIALITAMTALISSIVSAIAAISTALLAWRKDRRDELASRRSNPPQ